VAKKTIESPHQPRLGRTERRLLVAFAVVLLLLLGYAGYRWALARAVDAELDRIRANGYPATTAELEEWIGEPDDNLAPDVLALATRIVQPTGTEADLVPLLGAADAPPPGQPWPPEMRKAAADVLRRNQTVIDRLRALDWSHEARYIGDVTRDFDAAMPDYNALRDAANLLCLHAVFAAQRGGSDEAARSLQAVLELAHSMRDEPTILDHLVRWAIELLAISTLEEVMALIEHDPRQLANLSDALAVADPGAGVRRALIGERAITYDQFNDPEALAAQIGMSDFLLFTPPRDLTFAEESWLHVYSGSGLSELDQLAWLDYMREMMQVVERPTWEWLDQAKKLEPRITDASEWRVGLHFETPVTRALSGFLEDIARRRAALGALAVERYRLAHGVLPEALDDCVPAFLDAVPLDPHTGDPIRYQVESDRFTVYTVGEDKTDDGGVDEDNPPAGSEHYGPGTDITFTVPLERSPAVSE